MYNPGSTGNGGKTPIDFPEARPSAGVHQKVYMLVLSVLRLMHQYATQWTRVLGWAKLSSSLVSHLGLESSFAKPGVQLQVQLGLDETGWSG